jgi:hypothetical protein
MAVQTGGGSIGTIVTKPIRVAYMNGDHDKAETLIRGAGLAIRVRTVSTVEPYHGTIHVVPEDYEKAVALLDENKIAHYPATPYF